MKIPDIFDLYTDYLITSFSYTTASGLVDNAINHDQVTRFLSQQDFTSKELDKSKISGVFIAYYFNGNIIRVRNIS
jgi:hypothetical protein